MSPVRFERDFPPLHERENVSLRRRLTSVSLIQFPLNVKQNLRGGVSVLRRWRLNVLVRREFQLALQATCGASDPSVSPYPPERVDAISHTSPICPGIVQRLTHVISRNCSYPIAEIGQLLHPARPHELVLPHSDIGTSVAHAERAAHHEVRWLNNRHRLKMELLD